MRHLDRLAAPLYWPLFTQKILQNLRCLCTGSQPLWVKDAAALAVDDAVLHSPPQGLQRVAAGLVRIGKVQLLIRSAN